MYLLAFTLISFSAGVIIASRLVTYSSRQLRDRAQQRSNSRTRPHPRISKHHNFIKPEYDVVIIGSGYGGGVAASRMARAGKKVCLLERGDEMWPGEYPHTLHTASQRYRVEDRHTGRHSSSGAMSDLYQSLRGEGQDVFLGCGLGGTSLINAGVFIRADERVFEGQNWPVQLRAQEHPLEPYYERAERMLQPSPYPASMPKPRKLSVFEDQVRGLGLGKFLYRPPLTSSFEKRLNNAGVQMLQSTGSGNESTGINDSSKNSVLVTYLADAWAWGAEIFCGINVEHVREIGHEKGYVVYYSVIDSHTASKRLMWVRAKSLVILGAGAIGTTEILLRSRTNGLSTSPLLGQKLSGNGDRLAFAYNCDRSVNSVGHDILSSKLHERCGPTISACVDLRGEAAAPNYKDGYMIQDGAIPEALGPVIQAMLESRIPWFQSRPKITKIFAKVSSWIYGPYHESGSVNRTAVYLIMSHDENEGTLDYKNDRFTLKWCGIGAERRSCNIQTVLSDMTASADGMLLDAPCITVHPLGGVGMSSDGTGLGGVVNHMGQLYRGLGRDIYKGIISVDASIIPTSLGVNPCATITALAERCCDLSIRERNWTVDERPNAPLDLGAASCNILSSPLDSTRHNELAESHDTSEGLKFDETLAGFVGVASGSCDFTTASMRAKVASSSARLSITVDLKFLHKDTYKGSVTGTLSCGMLSQDSLLITRGSIDFFTISEIVSDAVELVYNMDLMSTEGALYKFHGYKRIDSRIAFSIPRTWMATTTLNTTITRADGIVVAKGILQLSRQDFIAELLSIRCNRNVSTLRSIEAKTRFLGFFLRNVLTYVFSPFRPLQYYDLKQTVPSLSCLKKPTPVEVWVKAIDGVQTRVKIWEPSPDVTSTKVPIVLIPGASVDDQIFSLPTIPTNAIDYFTSRGHRCYVPILRFGIGHEARNGWTVFDARLDVVAALQYIRKQENNKRVYAIVHCLGSIATATALLTGDVDASWFCGMTCSQVFTDLLYSGDNGFKARHQSLTRLYRALAGNWFSCSSPPQQSWVQKLLDHILRFYPVGDREEICNSAVCHRCNVPFGRCWNHANLNHATHSFLGSLFDGIHMDFLTHLSRIGATPPFHVRANLPGFNDLVAPQNLQRLAELKICFLSGGDNAVWQPHATKRSLDMFRCAFPGGCYERVVVQDYGHLDCWIGKDAYIDVYPRVSHHIEACEQGVDGTSAGLGMQNVADGYVNIVR